MTPQIQFWLRVWILRALNWPEHVLQIAVPYEDAISTQIWANKTLNYSKPVTSTTINLNPHKSTQIVRTWPQSPRITRREGKMKRKPTFLTPNPTYPWTRLTRGARRQTLWLCASCERRNEWFGWVPNAARFGRYLELVNMLLCCESVQAFVRGMEGSCPN